MRFERHAFILSIDVPDFGREQTTNDHGSIERIMINRHPQYGALWSGERNCRGFEKRRNQCRNKNNRARTKDRRVDNGAQRAAQKERGYTGTGLYVFDTKWRDDTAALVQRKRKTARHSQHGPGCAPGKLARNRE